VTGIAEALADAGQLRAEVLGPRGYAVAYGSHASGTAAHDADLDLLFVGPPLADSERARLTEAVLALHATHRLRLDTEVAYEVKVHATVTDVDAAVALGGFTLDATGRLNITPVVVEPWFLNSRAFKLRLILNALTTQHVFLGGRIGLYQRHCAQAERAITLAALCLLDSAVPFTLSNLVDALLTSPEGATEKDFLGYVGNPALHSTMQRGLARLISARVVTSLDGRHFRQHLARCQILLARLRSPAAGDPAPHLGEWTREPGRTSA
jgi:arginyl-tRNA synthetase